MDLKIEHQRAPPVQHYANRLGPTLGKAFPFDGATTMVGGVMQTVKLGVLEAANMSCQ
jgi:hypothetical protein